MKQKKSHNHSVVSPISFAFHVNIHTLIFEEVNKIINLMPLTNQSVECHKSDKQS